MPNKSETPAHEDYRAIIAANITHKMIWMVLGSMFVFFLVYTTSVVWRLSQPGNVDLGWLGNFSQPAHSGDIPSLQLPAGTIIAVNSSPQEPCPGPMWSLYEPAVGRFLVGAGIPPDDQSRTNQVRAGQFGGTQEVVLTQDQMPRHQHETMLATNSDEYLPWGGADGGDELGIGAGGTRSRRILSGFAGRGQPHDNVPPYIGVHFCVLVETPPV